MASRLQNLKNLNLLRRRKYTTISTCLIEQLNSHARDLKKTISPSLTSLQTYFLSPSYPNLSGAGVFISPNLILTSAQSISRISTFYQPIQNSDQFHQQGYIRHKSYIGSTVALTSTSVPLNTTPLALNFAYDIAILKIVNSNDNENEFLSPCYCSITDSPVNKDDILIRSDFRSYGTVRKVGKTVRKAPWPLDDSKKVKWIEIDWSMLFPNNSSSSMGGWGKTMMGKDRGRPWFNLDGEVVGVGSWEVGNAVGFKLDYGVPVGCIKCVLDYAERRRDEDPVVMDSWIDSYVVTGMNE